MTSATSIAALPEATTRLKLSDMNDSDLLRAVRQSNVSRDPNRCVVIWKVVREKLLSLDKGYDRFNEDQLRSRYKYVAGLRRAGKKH